MKLKKLFLLLVCFLAIPFFSAQTFNVDGINYYVINGTQNVEVGDNNNFGGSAIIPSTVNNAGITYPVTSIKDNAFYFCTNLTSLTIGNSVTSIGNQAFERCYFLSSVSLPNSLISIGFAAFGACFSLNSIIIPNSVTSIGEAAFASCSALTSLKIPSSITSIGDNTFYGCTSLSSIICDIANPLTINANVFEQVNKSSCSLTVPSSSVNAYKTANIWKDFNPIIAGTTLSTSELNSKNNVMLYPNPIHNEAILEIKNSEATKLEVVDMNGKLVLKKSLNNSQNTIDTSNLPKGVYLFKTSSDGKTSTTKVIKN